MKVIDLVRFRLKNGDECGFPMVEPCVWFFFMVKQYNLANIILDLKKLGPNNRVKMYFIDVGFLG